MVHNPMMMAQAPPAQHQQQGSLSTAPLLQHQHSMIVQHQQAAAISGGGYNPLYGNTVVSPLGSQTGGNFVQVTIGCLGFSFMQIFLVS